MNGHASPGKISRELRVVANSRADSSAVQPVSQEIFAGGTNAVWISGTVLECGFASSMKQVSGVKAEVDLDAAAPRFEF